MKKLFTTLVAILAIVQFSHAQWTGGPTGNVYYNGGNVGIGTIPSARLQVTDTALNLYSPLSAPVSTLIITHGNLSSNNNQYTSLGFSGSVRNGSRHSAGYLTLINPNSNEHASDFAFTLRSDNGNYNERLRITSIGRIGIGTSTPDATLSLANSSGNLLNAKSDNILRSNLTSFGTQSWYLSNGSAEIGSIGFTTPANLPGIVFFNPSGTGRSQVKQLDSAGGLSFGATVGNNNPPNQLVLTTEGKVGIGTAAPSALLTVQGSYADIHLNATGGGGNLWSLFSSNNSDGSFQIATGSSTAANAKLTISSAGNVGVGTTNPTSKLYASGNSSATGFNTTTAMLAVENTDPSTSSINSIAFVNAGHFYGAQIGYIPTGGVNNVGGALAFATKNTNGTSWTEAMRMINGNVGIGTTSPDSKLTVNGTLHSKEVKVDMNILPDYVFESSYNLLPLTDLKTFISENHHLPEVPSAKEVEKNGLKLGEMNALLLKKVEELTLYLIKKDEQAKEQQQQIDDLTQKFKNLKNHIKSN